MQGTAPTDDFSVQSVVTGRVAVTRLLVGLLQGVLLYILYHAIQNKSWPANDARLFAPMLLVALFAPVALISSLGHLAPRRIACWVIMVAVLAGGLALHDAWRVGFREDAPGATDNWSLLPSPLLFCFAGIGLYIAHALVLAAATDRRRIASYSTYFETAWKLAIQLMFSALFIGVLWLVLWLGASLFMLVKLEFLRTLLQQSWFSIPVTAFAFAAAFHLTDVRPGIVRGIRSLLLMLMSWLLPVATLLVAGFLCTLPFTGLTPLWATRHATAVLLGAAAVLVLLVNAAFQGGQAGGQVALLLRGVARGAAALLLPLVVIAWYAVGLRVLQYGWTMDRLIAIACLLVASCYAGGYLWATLSSGAWLQRVAPTNVVTAFVILGVLLALFSPIADPARIAVADQVARLEAGRVSVEQFDFDYLKFHGARYGMAALEKLKTAQLGADTARLHEQVEATLRKQDRWASNNNAEQVATAADVAANITVQPASDGPALPASFAAENWRNAEQRYFLPLCLMQKGHQCVANLIDLNGDGKPEILLTDDSTNPTLFMQVDRKWQRIGTLPTGLARCKAFAQRMAEKSYRLVPPLLKEIEVAGQRLQLEPAMRPDVQCERLGK